MAKGKERHGIPKQVSYAFRRPKRSSKDKNAVMEILSFDIPAGFVLRAEELPNKSFYHKEAHGKTNRRLAGQVLGPRKNKKTNEFKPVKERHAVNLLFNLDISVDPIEQPISTQAYLDAATSTLKTRVLVKISDAYLNALIEPEERTRKIAEQELYFSDEETGEWLSLQDLEARGEVAPISKADAELIGWGKAERERKYRFTGEGIAFYVIDWPVDDRQSCSCC